MAVRRRALERTGPFDETIFVRGDEEDWQRRHAAAGGRTRYLASAGLEHRRTAADSTLGRLATAAYVQGRAARRYDVRKGTAPGLHRELRTLVGCVWHTVRRRCAYGIVFAAHTVGRIHEWLAPQTPPSATQDDFASGTSGQVWGIRATTRAVIADALDDATALAQLQRPRLRRAAARGPRRRVLVLAIERTDVPNLLEEARAELARSRHEVRFVSAPAGTAGSSRTSTRCSRPIRRRDDDWLLVIDDDVALPAGLSRHVPVPRRALRLSDRAARAPASLARRLAGDTPPARLRRPRDRVRRDRPRDGVSPDDVRRAAPVPAAALRLGP